MYYGEVYSLNNFPITRSPMEKCIKMRYTLKCIIYIKNTINNDELYEIITVSKFR